MTAQTANASSDIATTPSDRRDAFARLTPFGWRWGLAVIIALLLISFFAAGYFVVYWRNADMDLMIVYSALAMNDRLPQHFIDHPAYFTILSVKAWFALMHNLGLLDAWTLSAIPSASNVPAFDAAMTAATRAGRIVALLTSLAAVLGFAVLIRALVRDWRNALLSTFAFALSGGVAVHMRILRSEMIAATLVTFAFLILIIAARRASVWRPLWIGAAACLCVLGMENKIHAILMIAALPLPLLACGASDAASHPFWTQNGKRWIATGGIIVSASLLLYLAAPVLLTGFDLALVTAARLKPLLFGRLGIYQSALMLFIFGTMIAYAVIWKISLSETIASMTAVIGGGALGLLALYIEFNPNNAMAVVNPIEKMLVFADAPATTAAAGGAFGAIVELLANGVMGALKRYAFFPYTSARPTVFLVWLIVPGIVYAWRRGNRQLALVVTLLMLAATGIDSLGVRRGLKSEYFVFSDPLIIIAGTLLLAQLDHLRYARFAYPIGVALIVLHVGVSQAEPVKHVTKKSGPQYICEWNQYYQPLLPLPWCDLPPRRP